MQWERGKLVNRLKRICQPIFFTLPINIEQSEISASREFPPGIGSHLLWRVYLPRVGVKVLIHVPAPHTLSRQLPSQNPQIPVPSDSITFVSSSHSSVKPLGPSSAHASASLLCSRKMCTAKMDLSSIWTTGLRPDHSEPWDQALWFCCWGRLRVSSKKTQRRLSRLPQEGNNHITFLRPVPKHFLYPIVPAHFAKGVSHIQPLLFPLWDVHWVRLLCALCGTGKCHTQLAVSSEEDLFPICLVQLAL